MKIIFNGQLYDENDPAIAISPVSTAVQFGQVVFETFRITNGRLPGTLKQHYERLFASAKVLGFAAPAGLSQALLDTGLARLLASLDLSLDYRVKIMLSPDWWSIKAETLPALPPSVYTAGVRVDDTVEQRVFPTAKAASPLYSFYQQQQAENQVFETLFFTPDDQLLEGNISNVIAVLDDQLLSPNHNVLPGITVREVFKQAEALGLSTKFAPVSRGQLQTASEIFLTNAVKGLVPVQQWGDWQRSSTDVYERLKD